MIYSQPRLLPAGDRALLIEFADEIDDAVNDRVHALCHELSMHKHSEIIDLVPAYSSLLVYYDPCHITYDEICTFLRSALETPDIIPPVKPRLVQVPTRYGAEFGPDLAFVSKHSGLTEMEVISLHASVTYRVYLTGFSPGFAYLGSVPEQIAVPRLEAPRTRVPAGSVGIAGRQTGIYPGESPGGWRLIGRISLTVFDAERESPGLLRPGDQVIFIPI
jgi:inhibitor of KinA